MPQPLVFWGQPHTPSLPAPNCPRNQASALICCLRHCEGVAQKVQMPMLWLMAVCQNTLVSHPANFLSGLSAYACKQTSAQTPAASHIPPLSPLGNLALSDSLYLSLSLFKGACYFSGEETFAGSPHGPLFPLCVAFCIQNKIGTYCAASCDWHGFIS